MAGTDCLYTALKWARLVSLTTCSFLTPPTRKPYKRQSASSVLHLVSRVSASFRHFCVQPHVRLQSTSRKCPAAAKEERDSAREEPSAIAKCSGTTSRASPRQVERMLQEILGFGLISSFSACHPSSGSSWRRQAHLWTHLRGNSWRAQGWLKKW